METRSYRLGRAGRRMGYLLLAGAVLIWGFALWTLKNTLQISLRPGNLGPSLQNLGRRLVGAAGATPLTPEEAVPAVVMLLLVLIVPLLIWNILEELNASFTVEEAGITFRSLGIELHVPWEEIVALRPVEEEDEDRLDELVLREARLSSIRNPLVRFLHRQAYGGRCLPLYGGLENREALLAQIRARLAPEAPVAAEGGQVSGAA
ncbi:MAG: hypothetical protein ACP5SI_11380 [Chloroflexia bacterium]